MTTKVLPKISVITVVRNDASNLRVTIEDVSNQRYPNLEFIVIDGGSTDDTLDVIRSNVGCISYWTSERDHGIYDAMNKGLRFATGDYVNFLNAGDRFFGPDVLTRVADEIIATDADIIYGQSFHRSGSGYGGYLKGSAITPRSLVRTVPFCHQALFTKRELFETVGVYDLAYPIVADYDWMLRYYKERSVARMHFIPYPVVEYDTGGFSFRNISKSVSERKRLTDHHFRGQFRISRTLNYLIDSVRVWAVSRMSDSGLIHYYRRMKYYRKSAVR
jgi:glycosyltransferase involved in cell wall biosynthesis